MSFTAFRSFDDMGDETTVETRRCRLRLGDDDNGDDDAAGKERLRVASAAPPNPAACRSRGETATQSWATKRVDTNALVSTMKAVTIRERDNDGHVSFDAGLARDDESGLTRLRDDDDENDESG